MPLGMVASARVAPPPPPLLNFIESKPTSVFSGFTKTFVGMNFGAPSATRTLVAAIGTRVASGAQISSVTIGGVQASIDANTSPLWPSALIARAVVPTETSGDIVVTYASNESGPIICGLYASDSPLGIVDARKHYGGAPMTVTLSHNAGDALVAVASTSNNNDVTYTWTGLAPDFTYDRRTNGANFPPAVSGGHWASLPSGSTTLLATPSGYLYSGLAAVAYRAVPVIPAGTPVFDSFNRPNATWGLGFADSGHLWQQVSTGVIGIIDGKAYRVSGHPTKAYLDFGQQDMEVTVDSVVSQTWSPIVGARVNSDGSGGYWIAKNSQTTVKLVGYGNTYPMVNGDRIGLRVTEGVGVTNVALLVNGITQITWVDSRVDRPTGTHAALDMGNTTPGRAGNFSVEAVA